MLQTYFLWYEISSLGPAGYTEIRVTQLRLNARIVTRCFSILFFLLQYDSPVYLNVCRHLFLYPTYVYSRTTDARRRKHSSATRLHDEMRISWNMRFEYKLFQNRTNKTVPLSISSLYNYIIISCIYNKNIELFIDYIVIVLMKTWYGRW